MPDQTVSPDQARRLYRRLDLMASDVVGLRAQIDTIDDPEGRSSFITMASTIEVAIDELRDRIAARTEGDAQASSDEGPVHSGCGARHRPGTPCPGDEDPGQ